MNRIPINLLLCNLGSVDALVEAMGPKVEGGPLEVLSQNVLPSGSDGQVQVFPGLYVRVTPVVAPADAAPLPLIPVENLGRDADEERS